jgi:dihydrofolate reductase
MAAAQTVQNGRVAKLRGQISTSLDGYVAGPNPSEEEPLGEGGERLHEWVIALEAWRRPHGREGGEVNASTEVFEDATGGIGSTVMGRGMFGGGPGPWSEDPWRGWWGEEPPFHSPVFVLTHHAREPLELKGTTFHFVTDGIEAALERATAAAGGSDVAIGGGADVFQQYIAAGLVDEMWVNVVPVLLGGGTPLFDERTAGADLEQVRVVEGPGVAHLEYRRR